MWAQYRRVLVNSSGADVEDLAKPDVGTMVAATQVGADQHIRPTMHPERPSLADALGVMDRLNDQAAEKWDGQSPHLQVIAPEPEHGLVSTMGEIGLFYANTVCSFGSVPAGQNWDRLASAVHRGSSKLVDVKEVFILLSSDGELA